MSRITATTKHSWLPRRLGFPRQIWQLELLCFLFSSFSHNPAVFAQSLSPIPTAQSPRLVDAVDPFIGTGGNGHTYPGATVPFGMVQLSPNAGRTGWEWCSGYRFADSSLIGFSHTHLSGTGCADLGDVLFTPALSSRSLDDEYRSPFSHEHERARPGYYGVDLLDSGIGVELTATARTGMHRYRFPRSDSARIIINVGYGQEDSPTETYVRVLSDTLITGYRFSSGWAAHQKVFFAARFSAPTHRILLMNEEQPLRAGESLKGKRVKAVLFFSGEDTAPILAKVGISAVSMDGALRNCDTEIPHWDFDRVVHEAENSWEQELAKVRVTAHDEQIHKVFYTALYHSMLAPTLYCDVDDQYRGADDAVHTAKDFQNYSTFSLWDTYRATHPLFTLLHPARVNDMVKSMLAFYREGSLLPIWPLAANETYCMIGYHSVPVIAEAYLKGIGDFSPEEAFDAMKRSALGDRAGLRYYNLSPPRTERTAEGTGSERFITQQWDVRGGVVGGYAASRSGESIAYRSSHPRATRALITRTTTGAMAIEWTTDPVPTSLTDPFVTFAWLAGMPSNKGAHRFSLSVQGEALVEFRTSFEPTETIETFTGKDSATLTFVPQLIDRFGDRFGVMFLRIPREKVVLGEPRVVRVVGEQVGSPDWYMTFEYALRETMMVVVDDGCVDADGSRFQFVRVELDHLGSPVRTTVTVEGVPPCDTLVTTGHTILRVRVPDVTTPQELTVRATLRNGREYQERLLMKPVRPFEYVPADREAESVSKTLEYAYDDWCIAQMARALGRKEDETLFLKRAGYYRSLFDSTTGFMRGRTYDGKWVVPFNPRFATAKQPEYTEGNAWQYSWSVQHDVHGLIALHGGREKFTAKLDSLFDQSSDLRDTGAPADVSGLMGMYAHGNEPSHHVAYLYNYSGQPWKTQERVAKILRSFYTAAPDGVIGNEDCGQMSSWYVFSAMGLYPVDPVSQTYVFGSPILNRASISLGNGKTFSVITQQASPANHFIQSVKLNGDLLKRTYMTHDEFMQGGELVFTMGPMPNKRWGSDPGAAPPSMSRDIERKH